MSTSANITNTANTANTTNTNGFGFGFNKLPTTVPSVTTTPSVQAQAPQTNIPSGKSTPFGNSTPSMPFTLFGNPTQSTQSRKRTHDDSDSSETFGSGQLRLEQFVQKRIKEENERQKQDRRHKQVQRIRTMIWNLNYDTPCATCIHCNNIISRDNFNIDKDIESLCCEDC